MHQVSCAANPAVPPNNHTVAPTHYFATQHAAGTESVTNVSCTAQLYAINMTSHHTQHNTPNMHAFSMMTLSQTKTTLTTYLHCALTFGSAHVEPSNTNVQLCTYQHDSSPAMTMVLHQAACTAGLTCCEPPWNLLHAVNSAKHNILLLLLTADHCRMRPHIP